MFYLLSLYLLLLYAEWSSTHALRHAGMYLFHPTVHAGPAHTPVVGASSTSIVAHKQHGILVPHAVQDGMLVLAEELYLYASIACCVVDVRGPLHSTQA
jgi:hypothetical protein